MSWEARRDKAAFPCTDTNWPLDAGLGSAFLGGSSSAPGSAPGSRALSVAEQGRGILYRVLGNYLDLGKKAIMVESPVFSELPRPICQK